MRALETRENLEEQTDHNQKKHRRSAAPLPTKKPQELESRTGHQIVLEGTINTHDTGMPTRQRAGQQLARNSY